MLSTLLPRTESMPGPRKGQKGRKWVLSALTGRSSSPETANVSVCLCLSASVIADVLRESNRAGTVRPGSSSVMGFVQAGPSWSL